MGRDTKSNAEEEPFLVTHNGAVFDIAPFVSQHPGGVAHLRPYKGRSVSTLLKGGHGASADTDSSLVHSLSATYLLNQYRVGDDPKKTDISKNVNGLNGFKAPLSQKDSPDEIEDLEHLVDWSKPMLDQVASLGYNYTKWVNLPVDKPLRLFENPILEKLSRAKWYYVPIYWIPVFFFFLHTHFAGGFSVSTAVFGIVLGVFIWTVLEYTLHRWLFHMEPPGKSPRLITFHFLMHGLHHKVPFDGTRLVFPPFPASILGSVIYLIFKAILPDSILFSTGAGITFGYLFYDLFHYYLHFGSPSETSHFYFMKRYHNQHHYAHHDSGYGITSPLWDKIFGTKIVLKKLAKAIKW